MIPRFSAAAVAVLALAAGPILFAATPLEERIQRVENGLQRGITVRGTPVQRMNIAERMNFYKVPGVSIAVIHEGKLEWARGYGKADVESGKPVTTETVFQAASISKPVAAMTALRLVEQGKLSLDEDVNAKLRSWKVPENEFTQKEKVTLRRLLSHNAGLTVHGFPGYAQGAPVPTLVQILDGVPPANTKPVRVDKKPGSGYRYAGGGYEVMQLLIEDVTGKPFEQLARELVLDPLGMQRSAYEQPLGEARSRDAASAYRGDGKPIAGRWHTYPEKAAAGLWTTPSDLAKIILEIQKPGKVLQQDTVNTMLTRSPGDYALGIGLHLSAGRLSFAHGGANEGYQCMLFGYREPFEGAVVMTNGDRGSRVANEILASIAVEYGWVDYLPVEKKVVAVDPAKLQSYAGDYQFPNGTVVQIRVKDGKLTSSIGGDGVAMLAEAPDLFFDLEGNVPATKFVEMSDGTIELDAGGGTAKRKK